MTDLTKAIEAKSDQLNADDLAVGPRTIKITKVIVDNKLTSQAISIYFVGDNGKPWKPSKGMTKALCQAWNTVESDKFVGKSVTLFRDPTVIYGGSDVGGIRVSHVSDISKPKKIRLRISRTKFVTFIMERLNLNDEPSDDVTAVHAYARNAATQGKDAFGVWWKSATPDERGCVGDIMDELKELAAKADAADDEEPYVPI